MSFSHRGVGSSILASLSEAGGNDSQKPASKPLPPRLPFFTSRQSKRTHRLIVLHNLRHFPEPRNVTVTLLVCVHYLQPLLLIPCRIGTPFPLWESHRGHTLWPPLSPSSLLRGPPRLHNLHDPGTARSVPPSYLSDNIQHANLTVSCPRKRHSRFQRTNPREKSVPCWHSSHFSPAQPWRTLPASSVASPLIPRAIAPVSNPIL